MVQVLFAGEPLGWVTPKLCLYILMREQLNLDGHLHIRLDIWVAVWLSCGDPRTVLLELVRLYIDVGVACRAVVCRPP